MLESINKIAHIVGADRATVKRRANQLGLEAVPGEKQATLYETEKLLQLVPPPVRDVSGDGSTLEEARIRQTNADAELKELAIEKEKGRLADVSELLDIQNELFDQISTQIKNSGLSDSEKDDLLGGIVQAVEKWAES